MRRCVYLAIPILSLGLFACEDGPNQTYSPATGTLFNSGGALAATGDAGGLIFTDAGTYESYAGSSKQEVCGGAELQQQWSKMVQMPIAPPRFYAGLDVAGGDKYPGITVSQAINGPIPLPDSTEPAFIASAPHPSRLCQNTIEGAGPNSSDVGGDLISHWGNNAEVQMEYVTSTTKDYIMYLNPGYSGGITWQFTPLGGTQAYSYHFQINSPITRTPVDGSGNPSGTTATFNIDWGIGGATLNGEIDELYRGLVSNFAPDLYSSTEAACKLTKTCGIFGQIQGDAQGRFEFGLRPISFYVFTYNANVSAQLGNTVAGIYSFNIKYAPYSLSSSNLSLAACGTGTSTPLCPFDQNQTYPLYGSGVSSVHPAVAGLSANIGPVAYVTNLGDKQTNCVLKLNDTFGNLLDNCVNTSNDAATNTLTLNKIEGNLTHDDQNYTFSVVGINQNYRPAALQTPAGQFTVVADTDVPQPNDTADDFYLDTRAAGPIENDEYPVVAPDGSVSWAFDYHGSGAVMKEYQRLVQTRLAADYVTEFAPGTTPKTLHDPSCLYPAGWQTKKGFDATTFEALPGCTGFEGLTTSGPPDSATDQFNLYNAELAVAPMPGDTASPGYVFYNVYGTSPGGEEAGFEPGGFATWFCNDPGTYQSCTGDLIFGNSFTQVLQTMGKGDLTKIPLEARDVRFYFRMYEIAKAEYMHSTESLKRGANVGCSTDAAGDLTCAGTAQNIDSTVIQNADIDLDYLILDSIGGGADRAEYVDFTYAGATADPMSLEDRDILIATNIQSTDFFQRLDREERALFVSMGIDDGEPAWGYLHDAAGKLQLDDEATPRPIVNATMLLTNVFGSSTLANVPFKAPNDADGKPIPAPAGYVNICDPTLAPGNKDAYYCATHLDDDCSQGDASLDNNNVEIPVNGFHAPLATDPTTGKLVTDPVTGKNVMATRENGKPLLYGYCGAFLGTAFTVGSTSPMELISTQELQQTAIISMPVLDNPYDVTSTNNPVQVLVPWKPMQEGTGYPVMFDGQQDVFVQTFSLDFSGQVVTPVVDYFPIQNTDDAGNVTSTNIQIAAVESEDFLGDVFLCYDSTTKGAGADPSNPGDLLAVHLFTSVTSITNWLTTHPNAATRSGSCGIIIRFSPFNNYVDYIQSTANGVRLGVDQGSGGGRIADATLFTPGTGVQASQ